MLELHSQLKAVTDSLKDFQKATVKHVVSRLFDSPSGRMLVADEVGLGKTIVAKGVIAEGVRRHLASKPGQRFRVAYICSNQAIAQENQQKLQVFRGDDASPMYNRIAELAYSPAVAVGKVLEINSLTPGTSFNVTRGAGNWVERLIVYRLLLGKFSEFEAELKDWVRAGVGEVSWQDKINEHGWKSLRSDLSGRYLHRLGSTDVRLSPSACEELGYSCDRPLTLLALVKDILGKIRQQKKLPWGRWESLVALRRALVECCIDYVDADLFILDEFQRFRALIDQTEESEEAKIAKNIFSRSCARILLLSATPFKAFTGADDEETGEAHDRELLKVLSFLSRNDIDVLQHFETARGKIHRQLAGLGAGSLRPDELSEKPKQELESLLGRYISRTERGMAAGSGSLMLEDSWRHLCFPFSRNDIETFKAIDHLAMTLSEEDVAGKRAVGLVEYAKSAAFPLSYLDGYQYKELLRKHKDHPKIRKALAKSTCAWINEDQVNSYQLNLSKPPKGGGGNARLTQLIQETVGETGHLLLWIPPSLPYYSLSGPFGAQPRFSKTLVFSGWQLVPRMIGTLLSYEVERRHKNVLKKYFHVEKERRQPEPQLKFKTEKGGSPSMTLFTLLYPCKALSDLAHSELFGTFDKSYQEVKDVLAAKISQMLQEKRPKRTGEGQEKSQAWYWYAPFLLDANSTTVHSWLARKGGLQELKGYGDETAGLTHHFDRLSAAVATGGGQLGEFPDDLSEHLAIMALGSPAIVSLRALTASCPNVPLVERMVIASQLASGFLEMYNKPEAIAAIRQGKTGFFWRRALVYAGEGCLHAMVDEYLHMLFEQTGDLDAVKKRFLNSIAMFTASVNVESLKAFRAGKNVKKAKMRCHYAVDMGNQKIETEEGQQRVVNIRESFNSPFRPFVLASTSIGQEGLDFHWYCRRLVHWNIPSNPIDLEQREGRINRYKSLVIRRRIASRFGAQLESVLPSRNVWEELMEMAELRSDRTQHCQLQPFWHIDDESEGAEAIERLVPLYPFSRDKEKLSNCLKVLTLYRVTFGQPRQEELLQYLLRREFSAEEIAMIKSKLLINLSPSLR